MIYRNRTDSLKIKPFKYVIIDTDGGADDCQALVALDYLVRKEGKVLLGITCCDGNTYLKEVINNVLIAQAVCGSHYPVYPGIESSIAG